MNLGIRAKLFVISLGLVSVGGLTSAVYLEHGLRDWLMARVETELRHNAGAAKAVLHASSAVGDTPGGALRADTIDPLADTIGHATACRITVISPNGTVVGDTRLDVADVRALPNHGERPEVRRAWTHGEGVDQRFSETLGQQTMYLASAWQTHDGVGVVRASMPIEEIDQTVERLRWMVFIAGLLGLALAGFISALGAHLWSQTLQRLVDYARGVAHGEPDRPPIDASDTIVGGLAGSIHRLSDELGRTVDALAHERDRFEAVLQHMAEAVIAVDADRRVTLVNQAAIELADLDTDAVGRPVVEVVRAPGLQAVIDQAENGQEGRQEFDISPTSKVRVVCLAAPYQTGIGTVVVMHDITELRRLETIRRDFIANVSHELRTPVSNLRATAETLRDGAIADPDHGPRFLEALIRNAERMTRLINDLLDISRIEAGQYAIDFTQVDVANAVDDAVEAVAGRAAERQIDVHADLGNHSVVLADPQALHQVLVNLVDNAVKYTQQSGRVCVDVDGGETQVRIDVVDDGPGIPAGLEDRVFERFFRVDPGRSRDIGGTGLGLSIVKHLVGAMDGQVGYRAAAAGGSIFWVSLPRPSP